MELTNETKISGRFVWNGKGGIRLRVSILFRFLLTNGIKRSRNQRYCHFLHVHAYVYKNYENKNENHPEGVTGSVLGQQKLKDSLGPLLQGEKLSQARRSPFQPSQIWQVFIWEKKLTTLPESRAGFPKTTELAHALIRVDPAERAKILIWRNAGPARRVILKSKQDDLAKRVTLLSEPTFCFSCKGFVKFCEEM